MDVKRFFAKDAKSAIQKVRDCFGDEAIILSNKKTQNGIEIIAAKENKPYYSEELPIKKINQENTENFIDKLSKENIDKNIKKSIEQNEGMHDPVLQKMHAEIRSFKQLLGHQLLSEKYKKNPVKAAVFEYGKEFSLSDEVIYTIFNSLKDNGLSDNITDLDLTQVYKDIVYSLKNHIKINENNILGKNRITALVGTNGVGKTTMVCKLAADMVLKQGSKDIVILSSDTQKVGASDGLTKMANILEIENYFVDNKKDLLRVYELNRDKVILLDTPGFSLNETLDTNRPLTFTEFAVKLGLNESIVDNHLVIPVIYQNKVYRNLIKKFKVLDIKSSILTMFDSVTDLGVILSDLIYHNIPLTYYSDGIKIPQSLHRVTKDHLIETLLFLTNSSYNKIAD